MPIIKEYEIKGLGNFHIRNIEKDFEIIPGEVTKKGYYGVQGVMTVTENLIQLKVLKNLLDNIFIRNFTKKEKSMQYYKIEWMNQKNNSIQKV